MATQDKSRQQSSFSPQSGTQHGSGAQSHREEQGSLAHTRNRSLTPRQGAFLGAADRNYGSPFSLMQRLTADMDRLFENFGFAQRGVWPFAGNRQGDLAAATWSPQIEMFEQDGKLIVQAELPGLRKEDVQVQIEDDSVVIAGERRIESQRNQGGGYVSELSYGSFYRVIPLPDGANAESANATFRDGMLRIEMPLDQRQRGRKLEITDVGTTQASGGRQQGDTTG